MSLAERARKLGLEPHALSLLDNKYLDLKSLCNDAEEELSSVDKINDHITHLVADIIYKDTHVMEEIRRLYVYKYKI